MAFAILLIETVESIHSSFMIVRKNTTTSILRAMFGTDELSIERHRNAFWNKLFDGPAAVMVILITFPLTLAVGIVLFYVNLIKTLSRYWTKGL